MSGEIPQYPEPQPNLNIADELTAYLDKMETPLRERIAYLSNKEHPRQLLGSVSEADQLQQSIDQLERLKQNMQQGDFSGMTALLQPQQAEAEEALAASRQKLHPRGEMTGDEDYFKLKDEILTGEALSKKVDGIVDDTERAWLGQSIEMRKQRQYETTDRGRVMDEINQNNQTVKELTSLQELIPQPPQEQ